MTAPSVGLVIPARNASEYIGEAIESALAQRGAVPELVVVDDGSTDETSAVAATFGDRVRCVRQEPLGPAVARNRGVASLHTELVAFLDADDLWTPDSLQSRLEAFAEDPSVHAVFGHMVQFVCDRLTEEERSRLSVDPTPQPGWGSGSMLIRRDAFHRTGGFPEHRRAGDFLEWFLAAGRDGMRSRMIETVVLRRRVHRRNLTRTEPETNLEYVRIVRAELARRRAEADRESSRTDAAPPLSPHSGTEP